VPEIPIWLSLSVILGVLVVATVASLVKTRGELVTVDEPDVEEGTAEPLPTGGPETAAAARARVSDESDGERGRR